MLFGRARRRESGNSWETHYLLTEISTLPPSPVKGVVPLVAWAPPVALVPVEDAQAVTSIVLVPEPTAAADVLIVEFWIVEMMVVLAVARDAETVVPVDTVCAVVI